MSFADARREDENAQQRLTTAWFWGRGMLTSVSVGGVFNPWLEQNLVGLGVWALTVIGTAEIVRGIVTALR